MAIGKKDGSNKSTTYNPFVALSDAKRDSMMRDAIAASGAADSDADKLIYEEVLTYVQTKISESEVYNRALTETLDAGHSDQADKLMNIIITLLQKYRITLDTQTIDDYKQRIYDDMAGFSVITEPLHNPDIEEINVYGPGPKQIEIVGPTVPGGKMRMEDGFSDAQTVLDIAKRLSRLGGMVVDQSNPIADSYIGGGIRVSVMIPPVIREDKGAVISIRKQTRAKMREEDLLRSRTAMPEELEFLDLLMQNEVSGAIVGSTGAGKTTLLNYMLRNYVEHVDPRIYVLEESRELQLQEDAKVFYTAVCGDEKNGTLISAQKLTRTALRFDPNLICSAEMRGAEALDALTAAQTGHVVWSSLHAESCPDAYDRMLTMCMQAGTSLSETILLRNLVRYFPIMVSVKMLKDGSRKITGIYEAERIEKDGTVVGHFIYRMQIDEYEYGEDGKVKHVKGHHARVGDMSDALAQKIFDNCGQLEVVKKFAREGWMPEGVTNGKKTESNVKTVEQAKRTLEELGFDDVSQDNIDF